MSGPGNLEPSGDSNYEVPATDVIASAFRDLAVINEDENPTDGMYAIGLKKLNLLIKELEGTGIHVWTEEEALQFLQPGQARYLIGNDQQNNPSPDHAADAYSYLMLEVESSMVAAQSILSLPVGITLPVGWYVGIVLDNGAIWWTTIAKTIVNVGLTLTVPIPSSASAGNFVFSYQTNIVRPLKVPVARTLTYSGLTETPWSYMYSRQEYMDLPNKNTPGVPTQGFYTPKIPQGQLFVYPVAQQAAWGIRFTWYRPLQNFNGPDDLADLPQEWSNALEWILARDLGPSYSVPAQRWATVQAMAEQKAMLMLEWDRESEDIQFGLEYNQTQR